MPVRPVYCVLSAQTRILTRGVDEDGSIGEDITLSRDYLA